MNNNNDYKAINCYDKLHQKNSKKELALWLFETAQKYGCLYVDFYAIRYEREFVSLDFAEIPSENQYKESEFWKKLKQFLTIGNMDNYICVKIGKPQEIEEIWEKFVYSTPKLYRVNTICETPQKTCLKDDYLESFQWLPIEQFAPLLNDNPIIFRDNPDEIAFDIITSTKLDLDI